MKLHLPLNSLRIRFALGFGLLFSFFLSLALIIIYLSFADFRKDEFYKRLKDRALTTFKFKVELEQIDDDLLRLIDRNTLNTLYEDKVMIFEDSSLVYSSIDDEVIRYDSALFDRARKEKEVFTTQDSNEVVALSLVQNKRSYIILASAYDRYGRSKMNFLRLILSAVYLGGLSIGWIVTYFFVRKIIQPLDALKSNLGKIDYDNLHTRLEETGQGEEVNSLSANFNQLLERLERSFRFQKNFIHYASHELRTPLAAMIGLTETALNYQRDPDQDRKTFDKLYQQQKNLTEITNSLLLLSDQKIGCHGQYPLTRLDELVFRSVDIINTLFPEAFIEVELEGQLSNEQFLLIPANEALMLMALNNLLKNAIQYSPDKRVSIVIRFSQSEKQISILNSGIAFSKDEQQRIFTPFYRASNAGSTNGHGLGLPLVKQILQLHKAGITYSYQNDRNEFRLTFEHEHPYPASFSH